MGCINSWQLVHSCREGFGSVFLYIFSHCCWKSVVLTIKLLYQTTSNHYNFFNFRYFSQRQEKSKNQLCTKKSCPLFTPQRNLCYTSTKSTLHLRTIWLCWRSTIQILCFGLYIQCSYCTSAYDKRSGGNLAVSSCSLDCL